MTTEDKPPAREHQLEVLQSMTELLDSLATKEAKREVLAFLAASQGVEIRSAPAAHRTGYRPRPKRGY